MKPIYLKFCGINSFSQPAEIDFAGLTKSGLFGIFGDTGSGKSTVLDAINFALYGRCDRMKDDLTSVINYNCDEANVVFTFDMSEYGKRVSYTVERTIKRKSNGHKAKLFRKDGEKEECIADNASTVKAEICNVLGVNAEDFKKCIALPQGEFSEFVKSAPSDRIALIERLFSLSRYGKRLNEKLRDKIAENEGNFQNISGKLSVYENVSEEKLKEAQKELEISKKAVQSAEKQFKKAEKEYEEINRRYTEQAEYLKTVEELNALLAERGKMDGIRKNLKIIEFCKNAVKFYNEIQDKRNIIENNDNKLSMLAEQLKRAEINAFEFKKQLEDGEYDKKIEERLQFLAKVDAVSGKSEMLDRLNDGLKDLRNRYKEKETQLLSAKERVAKCKEIESQAERDLKTQAEIKLENLIDSELKGIILRSELESEREYFFSLKKDLTLFEERGELYGFVFDEIKKRIAEINSRIAFIKDFKIENVEKKLKDIELVFNRREAFLKALGEAKTKLLAAENEVKTIENELASLKKDGTELRKQADSIKSELESVFGENTPEYGLVIKENRDKLSRLRAEKAEITEKYSAAGESVSLLKIEIARIYAETNSFSSFIVTAEREFNECLKLSEKKSVEECKILSQQFGEISDAEKSLKEYEIKLAALEFKLDNLKTYANMPQITQDALSAAEREKTKLAESVKALNYDYAVKSGAQKDIEKRLADKTELQKEYVSVTKERDNLLKLKELLRGNGFIAFIANEYLSDISHMASGTLLKLTDGRYFLTYTDSFFVGDNFDSGKLRSVNTLSGGETFLVSLSLALALSQTICAKSLKSIEFFFLDEGFGTLDSTLVDTVMGALEKLKSSYFTIGVISHVEELKHRIDCKITVNKATESRGSTLSVSC